MESYRFIHMSDIHFLENYSNEGFEALIAAKQHPKDNVFKALSKEIKEGLDFILITGDLAHEGEESDYRALYGFLKELTGGIPFIVLPGNHDRRGAYCKVFFAAEPEAHPDRVYDLDGLRIITLDTGNSVDGRILKEQLDWLLDVLSIPAPNGTLLALHHPLIPGQEGLNCAEYDPALYEIIGKSDILGIFCGHTHKNYISRFAGKPYYTSDSMSFSMTAKEDSLQFEDHAAYNLVTLSDGILSVQVRQVVPETSVIAGFALDKLSQLFSK